MVNKVILIGNLGADPEVRHLENGSVVGRFSIATNERYKDKSGETKTLTEWHDIIVWRKLAEIAEQYLTKGKMVYVEGKLTHRKWTDKDNIERYTTEVVANNFQILDRKSDGGGGNKVGLPGVEDERTMAKPAASSTTTESPAKDSTPPASQGEDDLPF